MAEPTTLNVYEYKRCWRTQADFNYDPSVPDGNNLADYSFHFFEETILVDADTNEVIRSAKSTTPKVVGLLEIEKLQPGLLQHLLEGIAKVLNYEPASDPDSVSIADNPE